MHDSDQRPKKAAVDAGRVRPARVRALLVLTLALCASANAQDPRHEAREREAIRRLQAAQSELQRVAKERDQLLAEREAMVERARIAEQGAARKATQSVNAVREAAAREQKRQADEIARLSAELQTVRKAGEASARDGTLLLGRLKEVSAALAASETQRRELEGTLDVRGADGKRMVGELATVRRTFNECEAQNARLHAFGKELLDRYSRVSVREAMARNEPFLGLKRVELENVIESYRDRLDAARMVKPLR